MTKVQEMGHGSKVRGGETAPQNWGQRSGRGQESKDQGCLAGSYSIEHETLDLLAVGSSPMDGVEIT